MAQQALDIAKTLVKSVMRAFYETRHILIIDALIIHSALRDDDLAYLMATNTKDLHKACGKLREDRFLAVYTRLEYREDPKNPEAKPRPVNRTYYYIDYRQTIDAIKWRVYTVDKQIQGTTVPASERKEYFCGRCKAEWTQMEVLDNVGPDGFACHRCGSGLTHDLERNSTGHEQSTRLNNQFKFITELLPAIDNVVVPDNTFDVAISKALPVVRDASYQLVSTVPVSSLQPTAVKGLDNVGPKSMSVSISTTDGPSEAEKAADKARKEKIAQQNALPSWMSNSTVTGESFSTQAGPTPASEVEEADDKDAVAQSTDNREHAELDDYFARLKAEQAAEAARVLEEEGSDDEEEEDAFEDVTPVGDATPVPKPEAPAETDESTAKRVKVEMPEDGESDEDVEFEDV
ncbi:Transcription initiation factor IIE subunit alpha [Colletotrichum orbiculare MAFF 240422]|uniref:Transcription initiation factor IIE subunit alpha n=1 Tax=Colletotrichum orbiculare (strain 104-T / ATCC 96160 / CBS 514.97 / LARS 414 / MAFF 240422) TaxID=1213857 RepID=N4VMJ6_COLOR|nr:Transcription initiation factor IIE subunit alpha [Colletotrichum orbiculare MAFF 240422]